LKKTIRIIARLNIGGPAIHAILLNSGLNKDGYKDILISGSVSESEGDMLYLAREHGVEPVIISELEREISFWKDFKAFLKLFGIMRRERPDIVHTHTAKAGALGRLAAMMAGVPIVVHTFHGHAFDGYFSPVKARIFLWIERLLGNFTHKVIAVSESVRDEISGKLKIVDRTKCVVIPLGLELDKFLDNAGLNGRFRARLGLPADMLLVGIVGRLVPIKNHSFFLKIARRARELAPDLNMKFLIIGDGELKGELMAASREMGLVDVIFTGWIRDLPEVYAGLDVVALTSLNEGTPVSLIEAMASGRAVISTEAGGVKDMIRDGENGVLVKHRDLEGFSAALVELLKNGKKRESIGVRGREFARERYCKERLLRDIERLYEECLSGRN